MSLSFVPDSSRSSGLLGLASPSTGSLRRADRGLSVCIVGGSSILRTSLAALLEARGIHAVMLLPDSQSLAMRRMELTEKRADLLAVLVAKGAFRAFDEVRAVVQADLQLPLVVLSDDVSAGQVRAALRDGATAYVSLETEPGELVHGLRSAAAGLAYVSPEASHFLSREASDDDGLGSERRTARLSRRELEIVQLLCEGLSAKQVARRLHLSAKTVENHRYHVYRKCGIESMAGLMRHAIQHGLVSI